jgi:ATP-dependent exoDNAse (exonuclease V) alpha subunit
MNNIPVYDDFINKIRREDGIDINPELREAFIRAEFTKQNIFVTGSAGVGKSVFIRTLCTHSRKRIIVLAPTGIAALNVQGETIHSFFGLGFGVLDGFPQLSRKLTETFNDFDMIIIDEISMVRSDVFNAINLALQTVDSKDKRPFGGKQIIVIGDMFQLPPVLLSNEKDIIHDLYGSRWWFDAKNIGNFRYIELVKVYRQSDEYFINLLQNFRYGVQTEEHIDEMNKRLSDQQDKDAILVTTVNKKADLLNDQRLRELEGQEHIFYGETKGNFPKSGKIAPELLKLKIGARMMCLRNLRDTNLVNGSLVDVVDISEDLNTGDTLIIVKDIRDRKEYSIHKVKWESYEYLYTGRKVTKTVSGEYTQYPLKLAYACTIHKGQGCTWDKVVIDFDRGVFECGQAYVALSRSRTFEGIHLKAPVKMNDFWVDDRVMEYFADMHQYNLEEEAKENAG